MNILYDDAMPYGDVFFDSLGNTSVFKGGSLSPEDLKDVDILLVRSTTQVDKHLLANANSLKMVGTATAGFDHLDIPFLQSRNIEVSVASGCNAIAVAQYVISALVRLSQCDNFSLEDKTLAIVGAGQVGTALSTFCDALNISYLLYDPPLQEKGDPRTFCNFQEVLQADIISLHTPLVIDGKYPTLHMFDEDILLALSSQQYLINACRGEVIDNKALLSVFKRGQCVNVVLDVWENEPNIDMELLPFVRFATAHIAGHTLEGKARGTSMLYDAICSHFACEKRLNIAQLLPEYALNRKVKACSHGDIILTCIQIYDIAKDDSVFRALMAQSNCFKEIRRNYPVRREYSAVEITNKDSIIDEKILKSLHQLGFQITD